MFDESSGHSGAMEKKLPSRQSPAQPKNNGVIGEKKSDYTTNRNGRQRKYKPASNGGRSLEGSQNPKPVQKYTQSYGDKRPRQRGYFNDRQGEEIVEVADDLFVVDDTNSRKGNANYLLKFSFSPRGESGRYDSGRGSAGRFSRSGCWLRRKTPATRYSPEQFLQASCQFIVAEGGEYTEQAINPDALVNWDMVEQVRTFSMEPVVCPICLETPCAGKITKCGHVYCWSCILHHLQEKELMCRKQECPICPHRIDPEELKSVLCLETRDFKVGDTIEMKLMRKSKGSVYVCPKSEWTDKEGVPHNIADGTITQYMKLLSATCDQIKEQVIKKEKQELDGLLQTAEGYETCYIQIAKDCLEKREEMLEMTSQLHSIKEIGNMSRLSDPEVELPAAQDNDGARAEATITYADAFEDQEENVSRSDSVSDEAFLPGDGDAHDDAVMGEEEEPSSQDFLEDTASSCQSSAGLVLPHMSQSYSSSGHLTPEEAADHLELPEGGGISLSLQRDSTHTKDTYYFYQASTGQHIYLSSLNAQCLTKEYGSLENSPEVMEAQIVAIERIFMNEDVRKRLRYLNHIPLTCEFHVVELRFQPPLVSRETLQHFQAEFDKRRKARLRKKKEEKERAKQQEMAHKASFGIFPEVQIPLDNLTQFPAHLGSSSSASLPIGGSQQSEPASVRRISLSGSGSETLATSPGGVISPRQRNDSEESQTGLMSFAQMLKAGKSTPQKTVWGRAAPAQDHPVQTSSTMPELRSPTGRYDGAADDDDGGEYLPAPPISSSWFDDISKAMDAHVNRQQAQEATNGTATTSGGGGKKKKKKEKQLLFSTSMARKG